MTVAEDRVLASLLVRMCREDFFYFDIRESQVRYPPGTGATQIMAIFDGMTTLTPQERDILRRRVVE